MPFPTESFLNEIPNEPTVRAFRSLYASWQAFFNQAGFNADGSFRNIIVNNIILQANPERPPVSGPDGAPVYGGITLINAPGSPSRGAEAFNPGCSGCHGCVEADESLLFSGFADGPVQARSFSGEKVTLPNTPVLSSVSGCGGLVAVSDGIFGVTGVTVVSGGIDIGSLLTYKADLSALNGSTVGESPCFSIATAAGKFFTSRSDISTPTEILEFNESGVITARYNTGVVATFPGFRALGVNAAASIAYFARSGTGVIFAVNLATLAVTTFVDESLPGTGLKCRENTILCLPDGSVVCGWFSTTAGLDNTIRRYDAAGTALQNYAVPTGGNGPTCLTPGRANGSSFWASVYHPDVTTFSGVRLYEFDVESGAVLNSFDPEDGTFEFDGPFCVVRKNIVS